MKARSIGLLVLAHTATDINQGAIPVLLPFLITAHHISYAAAATVVFAANLISLLAQPGFGYLADRRSRSWLIPVAMLCAGVGISAIGVMPNFELGVVVIAISGIGVAAFHPEGARLVHYLAEGKRATAMSYFAVGGQMGFAIGPLICTAAMLLWGLKGSLFLVLPTAIMAGFFIYNLSSFSGVGGTQSKGRTAASARAGQDAWAPFLVVSFALLARSIVFYGMNSFLPIFWIHALHGSEATGGTALTVFMAAGIGGNLLGGKIADRFGYLRVAITGFIMLTIVLPLFVGVQDPVYALLLIVLIGLAISLPTSPTVVIAQTCLPNHVGLASGVTLGLAFSFGGVMMPGMGWIADHYGLRTAFYVLAFLPALCTALMLVLSVLKTASLRPTGA